jgi:hypothetical protein
MIRLNINEIERLAELVAALTKLGVSVYAELDGNKWNIEVTK